MQFSIAISKVISWNAYGPRSTISSRSARTFRLTRSRASSIRPATVVLVGLAARGGQDHVEPDQLLDGAVVDRLGHAPAHLALGLHGAPRQLARAEARRRLRRAQQAHHDRGGERGQEEDGLVEGEQVRVERGVAADRDAGDESGRAEHGDHHAAPLALEVGVGGDQEQRGELHAHERVGRDQLEREQQREVDRRAPPGGARAPARARRAASTPADHSTNTPSTRGGAAVVREAEDRDRREGDERQQPAARPRTPRSAPPSRSGTRRITLPASRASATAGAPRAAAPAESISQSTGVPCRPSTKVWWNSSVIA